MATAWIYDPLFTSHETGEGHPECSARAQAVQQGLQEIDDMGLISLVPRPAEESDILRCHSAAYLDVVRTDVADGRPNLRTGDTAICEASFEVAMRAAGAVLTGVDAVMDGSVNNAFCAVRPPGHHATPEQGMGFCIFNNVAIGAAYVRAVHGIERVLIVDWDIHHGNGTQDCFYADANVFYFSTHQSPFYPGTGGANETGSGPGEGSTLNCPMSAGSGDHELMSAFMDDLLPAMKVFSPEFVFISAGFDAREEDPLGQFSVTDEGFGKLTALVLKIAQETASGRVVSVLEGGYGLPGLKSATQQHVMALLKGTISNTKMI